MNLLWCFLVGWCYRSKAERQLPVFRDIQNFCHALSQCRLNPRFGTLMATRQVLQWWDKNYYIWSRIANGPDKQIGLFHNEFLIKLALVFFSKLKVSRLLFLYHYIACYEFFWKKTHSYQPRLQPFFFIHSFIHSFIVFTAGTYCIRAGTEPHKIK